MEKSENSFDDVMDFYTQMFKASEGVWSLGAVLGDRRVKVEVQNQSSKDCPVFNVILGDLSMNDLILLFRFLSKSLSMVAFCGVGPENAASDDALSERTGIDIFDEDDERWENQRPLEELIAEKESEELIQNKNDDCVIDDLVFSDDVANDLVFSVPASITASEEDVIEQDELDSVFSNDSVGVPVEIPTEIKNNTKESNTEMIEKIEMSEEEMESECITGKDLEKATSLVNIFQLFADSGFSFEDEEEVISALKEAQKQVDCPALKGRRQNGLRTEWGKFWRKKTKTKGA